MLLETNTKTHSNGKKQITITIAGKFINDVTSFDSEFLKSVGELTDEEQEIIVNKYKKKYVYRGKFSEEEEEEDVNDLLKELEENFEE